MGRKEYNIRVVGIFGMRLGSRSVTSTLLVNGRMKDNSSKKRNVLE